ncbi:MAG: hypothetical protein QGI45_05160 [Myxococcota bacterium]|jgi:hypothetical protein|nr:hypothetical protein [Myxococcota bacterium]
MRQYLMPLSPFAICLIAGVLCPGKPAMAQDNNEARIVKLEADVQTLNWFLNPNNPTSRSEYRLRRALEVAVKNPAQAQAYFDLALKDEDLSTNKKALIHLEWGRILTRDTYHAEAIKHFLKAMETASRQHLREQALEAYAISLRGAKSIGELPEYLTTYETEHTHQGKLDSGAQEALYNISYALVRQSDQRSKPLLEKLSGKTMVGRRAFYLLGALEVQSKNYPKAQTYFTQASQFALPAITDPDLRKRDQQVRELSWLALGRVCFETRDFFNGIDAYQSISNTSSNFTDAVYEMGWFALDHGEHTTALAALEPLAQARPNDALGWQALLLKGYIMLQKNNYKGAELYYLNLVEYFAQRRAELAQELENLKPYTRLLDDPTLKQALGKKPFLQKLYQQADLLKAQTLSLPIQEFTSMDKEISHQYQYIETALDETKTTGASASLSEDINRIDQKKNQIKELKKAKLTQKENARLDQLDKTLGQLFESITNERSRIKKSFISERGLLDGLKDERTKLQESYQVSLKIHRDELLNSAVSKFQKRIEAMSIEGEAGVLQALWSYKEDQYNVIMGLVEARHSELGILEERFQETLEYLSKGPF